MKEYPKIQTIFKRNPETNFKTLLLGEFSIPEFEYLKDCQWIFTEKVDGTNIRVMWNHETKELRFGGKTDKAQIPTFLFAKLQDTFSDDVMEEFFSENSVCLYGEGYGAKIQKGGGNYISNGVDFILFDIRIGNWWLKRQDIEEIADKLEIKVVPIIGEGTLQDFVKKVSQGFMSQWGNFFAEGIVAKPMVDLLARNGERILTKLKHKDF